jgi:hypothetical protein
MEDLNLRTGNAMVWISLAVLIVAANILLWRTGPGLGWGLYAVFGIGLGLLNRRMIVWDRTLVLLLVMLVLTAVQTAHFVSMANFLVLHVLVFALMGHITYDRLQPAWTRWMQGFVASLNLVGSVQTFTVFGNNGNASEIDDKQVVKKRIALMLQILMPAACIVPVFAVLLIAGNRMLGRMVEDAMRFLYQGLPDLDIWTVGRILFSVVVLYTGCFLFRPGAAMQPLQKLSAPWPVVGKGNAGVRFLQWIVILLLLNLLFGLSTVTDVVYLWFSKTLPDGVNHSHYVHQGVYVLVFTTLLSALLMALITQHTVEVRENSWIKGLALLWIGQNLILISGVFLRLWMYVDAYGYTPKRVYVACFLALEIAGFLLLIRALLFKKGMQWLLGKCTLAVVFYLFILQFWNANGSIVNLNSALFRAGALALPEMRLLRELGTEGIRYLYFLSESTNDAAGTSSLMKQWGALQPGFEEQLQYDWRSYQWRRERNLDYYEKMLIRQQRLMQSPNPSPQGLDNGPDTDTTSHP